MMPPDQLRAYLQQQPFVPFRIHLTDGRSFDVRHPELLLVTARVAFLGVYAAGSSSGVPDQAEMIALIHVVSVELLTQPA